MAVPSLKRGVHVAVARFSRTTFFCRVGPRMMPPLERVMTFVSGGRVPLSGLLVPSLVLHTIGAKSGIERDSTLMYCPEPKGRILVTGSNFARETHPAWTANLLANPDAVVSIKGKRIAVRATLINDDERDAVWAWIEQQWPHYRDYEIASDRVLRIFRLERV